MSYGICMAMIAQNASLIPNKFLNFFVSLPKVTIICGLWLDFQRTLLVKNVLPFYAMGQAMQVPILQLFFFP